MGEKNKNKPRETSYLTSISQKTIDLIDYERIKTHIQSIRFMMGLEKDKEYYLEIGNHLVEILKEFDFFYKMKNSLKNDGIYLCFKDKQKYTEIGSFFKPGKQFDFTSESAKQDRNLEDIIVNVMYLSNKLAHILEENEIPKLEGEIDGICNFLFNTKHICIEELINLRREGRNIFIGYEVDERYSRRMRHLYYFALPNYMRVFSVHADNNYHNDFDNIRSFNEFIKHNSIGAPIPIRIEAQDYERLRVKSKKGTWENGVGEEAKSRIRTFLEVQKIFKNYKVKPNKELEVEEEKKEIRKIAISFHNEGVKIKKNFRDKSNQLEKILNAIKSKKLNMRQLEEKERQIKKLKPKVNCCKAELEKRQEIMKKLGGKDEKEMTIDELVVAIEKLKSQLAQKKQELEDITQEINDFENGKRIDEDNVLNQMIRQDELQLEVKSLQDVWDYLENR